MRLLSAALVLVSAVPIVAATADDAPAPMDLVWDATDVNGVALNPKWIGTTTSLAGHVNWYPGTFEGPIYWDPLSFTDGDNNVRLIPSAWVLAIHVKDDPHDDVWAVFMRHRGDEGFCSSLQHEVNWPRDRFTLTLPWRAGATSVDLGDAATQFLANAEGVSGWWRDVPGDTVNLTFALPPPSARTRVHGELHLRWSGPTVQAGARGRSGGSPPAPAEWEEQGGEAEAHVEDLLARLPADRREALEREAAPQAATLDAVPVTLQHGRPDTEETAASAASVTSRPDPARTAEDERRLPALIAAFKGRVPGPVGDALERQREQP